MTRIYINHLGNHTCLDCGSELARNLTECPVCNREKGGVLEEAAAVAASSKTE